MSTREKRLAMVVLTVVLASVAKLYAGKLDRQLSELRDHLSRLDEQKRAAAELLKKAPAPALSLEPDDQARATLSLLDELATKGNRHAVKIVSVERSSPKSYRVTLEGKFQGVMKFLGDVERADGRFELTDGEMVRSQPDASSRHVRAVLSLTVKG